MPIVTIIRPSWLDVEKAMIFLMSFWIRAHNAVKRAVIAPRHRLVRWIVQVYCFLLVDGSELVGKYLLLLLCLSAVVLRQE